MPSSASILLTSLSNKVVILFFLLWRIVDLWKNLGFASPTSTTKSWASASKIILDNANFYYRLLKETKVSYEDVKEDPPVVLPMIVNSEFPHSACPLLNDVLKWGYAKFYLITGKWYESIYMFSFQRNIYHIFYIYIW